MRLLITNESTPEELRRAAHRQDEDDLLREANRIYQEQLAWVISLYLRSDDYKAESSEVKSAVDLALRRVNRTLSLMSAAPIVGGYARVLREQQQTIARLERVIEKVEGL